ncbi:hypothetical protein TRP8649_01401 [Pelagimonas phthalicica]|uniref:Uncharacterized protein n=1 Tax=Pelagimonas phthalicica TaxID=1037362 RepID=A0A238J9G5_9RHOB|nr:hypothetical protein [Pelagimonas phthalicica]TDS94177.1 hypothetical protein CLV87_0671 [Pelagimonas phthalicica]SMX27298.1 hypothetical protein TRP8649_01401 [Pelagimonas phthalicica]
MLGKDDFKTEEGQAKGYLALMSEARFRLHAINLSYAAKSELPPAIVRENCFLQLRMLCELISLGCLVAHGDIEYGAKVEKSYKPRFILEKLKELRGSFFPQAVRVHRPNGRFKIQINNEDCITQAQIYELWNLAGSILHRGSVKNIFKGPVANPQDFSDVFYWTRLMTNLLQEHLIVLEENKVCMLVGLNEESTGQPKISRLEFKEAGGLDISSFDLKP